MNNLFIILKYFPLIILNRAAMNKNLIWSLVLMGLLISSTVSMMPIQKSYAAVTIESSRDRFFGPSMVRVLITETALQGSPSDEISVTVEAESISIIIPVREIGTSGQFELYVAAHTTANPNNPTQTDPDNVSIVRIFPGAANSGDDPNDNQPIVRGINADLEDGDRIKVRYSGTDREISFQSSIGTITSDRTVAGNLNRIKLRLTDQDANLDPTKRDEFPANTNNILNPPLTFAGGAKWVETGDNTAIFELSVGVNTMFTASLSIPTFPSSAIFEIRDHKIYDNYADAIAPWNTRSETTSTVSRTVNIQNMDGTISLVADLTLANGFQIRIEDADRNIDTGRTDEFDATIFGTGTIRFRETGDNTGVFLPDLSNNRVPINVAGTRGFDNTNKVFNVRISDIANDESIELTYNDPNQDPQGPFDFTISRKILHQAGTIESDTQTVSVIGRVGLTIRDNDINTNAFRTDSYSLSPSISGGKARYSIGNGLAELEVSVIGKTISGAPILLLTEVDANRNPASNTGIFNGEFRVGEIAGPTLEDTDKVKFEYIDNTEEPVVKRSVEVRIGKPGGTVSLDKSSYPPNAKYEVTIRDDSENKNANNEDQLVLKSGTINRIKITLSKGNTLLDITPASLTASETGINTGTFDFDLTIPTTVGAHTINNDWQLRVEYTDSNGDSQSDNANILTTTATLSVDKQVYALGDNIKITIVEPDWNRDAGKRDEINANKLQVRTDILGWRSLDTAGVSLDPDVIRETDNDSNTFEITIEEIDEDFVSRGGRVEIRYNDDTPTGGGSTIRVEVRVDVIAGIPEIIFDKDTYTPFEEACITIVDPSANIRKDAKDKIGTAGSSVIIIVSGMSGNDEQLTFEETGVDTGIFMHGGDDCIQLDATKWKSGNTNTSDGILPAARDKALRVEYETADGDIRLTRSALIIFNDATIAFDKSSYKAGESATITLIDPDLNRNKDIADSVSINAWSSTDRAGVLITLRETGDNTGVFRGTLLLSSEASTGARLQVNDGDTITVRYTDRTLPDPADYDPDTDATVSLETARIDATAIIGILVLPTERVPASATKLVDENNNEIDRVSVGEQVLISSMIKNNQNRAQDFVHIVKVTDANGNVVMLAFTQGKINAGESRTNAFSWTPEKRDTYIIEILVWESFAKPLALSPKISSTVQVM